MDDPTNQIPRTLAEWLQYGILASFGGIANYLSITVMKGRKFVWAIFSANVFISFFVGNLVGHIVPADDPYKDGWVMACGYCSFPVLAFIELQVTKWLGKFSN